MKVGILTIAKIQSIISLIVNGFIQHTRRVEAVLCGVIYTKMPETSHLC